MRMVLDDELRKARTSAYAEALEDFAKRTKLPRDAAAGAFSMTREAAQLYAKADSARPLAGTARTTDALVAEQKIKDRAAQIQQPNETAADAMARYLASDEGKKMYQASQECQRVG